MPELTAPTAAVRRSYLAALEEVRGEARRGHATAMLREGLLMARSLGIESALLTCDHDNAASRRVIEKAGGVLEDRRGDRLRFWVPTT